MPTIRVIELFAGIGSQAEALNRIGADWESAGIVEIDPYCVTAYNAIHGTTYKPADITKIESLPDCDLLTYSFPCTDISTAGKQKGFTEGSGTRSALVWEVLRLLKAYGARGGDAAEIPDNGKRESPCAEKVPSAIRRVGGKPKRTGLYDILAGFERDRLRHTAEPRTCNRRFDTERRRGLRVPESRTA